MDSDFGESSLQMKEMKLAKFSTEHHILSMLSSMLVWKYYHNELFTILKKVSESVRDGKTAKFNTFPSLNLLVMLIVAKPGVVDDWEGAGGEGQVDRLQQKCER